MNVLLNLIGIFSELFLIAVVLLCWNKEKQFDFRKDAFSYFGTSEKTKKIFNTGLFFCAILRLLFIGRVIAYFSLWSNPLLLIAYTSGCLTLLVSAVIPWDKHQGIHNMSAKGITVSSVLFILFIGLALVGRHWNLAIFNFAVFVLMSILAIRFLVTQKTDGVPQIIFLCFIILWDNVTTLALFHVI